MENYVSKEIPFSRLQANCPWFVFYLMTLCQLRRLLGTRDDINNIMYSKLDRTVAILKVRS